MRFLKKVAAAIDALNEAIGNGVIWLSSLLVVVVCYDVITRYFLRESTVAIQELEWHIFAIMFLLAAAYTLKHDRHVRVDVFYARFSEKRKALIDLVGGVIFLVPFSLLGIFSSYRFVSISFKIAEKSPDPGGLPARWLLKTAIPVGFFLLLLQAITLIIRSLEKIMANTGVDSETSNG